MPGIFDMDPQTQGLLAAAFAGLQASGPSRMPVSFGQVLGAAGTAGQGAFNAVRQENSNLALKDLQAKKAALEIERAKIDMEMQKTLMGDEGVAGILQSADPAKYEALGRRMALNNHPGGAGILALAEKLRKQKADEAQLATMKGAPLPQDSAPTTEVGLAPTEEEALQRVREAVAKGGNASIAVDAGKPGIFGSLVNSGVPAVAAQARAEQSALNAQPAGASILPQHWVDMQKGLAAQEATQVAREANAPPSVHVVRDEASYTGWSYKDLRRNTIVGKDAPPPATAGMSSSSTIPPEHKDFHGDDYLATLPTGMAAMVKSIATGEVDLAKAASMRYGNREAIMQRVLQYDPTYNQNRSRVWTAFMDPNGKTGQEIKSINTVIAHIGTLDELTNALKNGNVQVINAAVNRARTELGRPEINNANIAIQAVGNELMRTFRATGASEHEVEAWVKKFNADRGSPAQLKGAVDVAAELLKGRIDALSDQWTRSMGDIVPPPVISPKGKAVWDRLQARRNGTEEAPSSEPRTRQRYNPATGKLE